MRLLFLLCYGDFLMKFKPNYSALQAKWIAVTSYFLSLGCSQVKTATRYGR
jgi:hypothetical protein